MIIGLITLPPEVGLHILASLAYDITTLKNSSLTCRYLRPLAQYHLFAHVNFDTLVTQPHALVELRNRITTLHFHPDDRDRRSRAAIEDTMTSIQQLPRLRAFVLVDLAPYQDIIGSALQDRFGEFHSITELTLRNIQYVRVLHLQHLITSLVNLKRLTMLPYIRVAQGLSDVAARSLYVNPPPPPRPPVSDRPRLTYLSISPSGDSDSLNLDGHDAVLQWLPSTPTAQSLQTLVVPKTAYGRPMVALGAFGSSVTTLSLSLHLGAVRGSYRRMCRS